MGAFNTAVVTAKGQALLTKTLAGTCNIVFTKMCLSDAKLVGDLSVLSDLTQVKQSAPVSQISVKNDTTVSCEVVFTNTDLQTGYDIRAIGLYATDPDEGEILYSVSTADESVGTADWMPPSAGNGVTNYVVNVITTVANASKVEVVVDPTSYITKGEFNKHTTDTSSIHSRLEVGTGEKSVQQVLDTDSWDTDNEQVKKYVKGTEENGWRPIAGANNGLTIKGSVVGDVVKILVGAFGKLSTMMSGKSQTIGSKSHAEGSKCIALENNSHAEGNDTFAGGAHSHAEGHTTSAIGSGSHSEGFKTVAEGDRSHAEGYITQAMGDSAHSEGMLTEATGDYSHAEGYDTTASAYASHSEGWETEAGGYASHTQGGRTKTAGAYAFATGFELLASSDYQTVTGRANIEDKECKYLHIVGNGKLNDDYSVAERSNAHTIDWDGNAWYAGSVEAKYFVLKSSTAGSNKRFMITVDDSGNIKATEIK